MSSKQTSLKLWRNAINGGEKEMGIEFTRERRRWNYANKNLPTITVKTINDRAAIFNDRYNNLQALVKSHGVFGKHDDIIYLSMKLMGHPPTPF